MIDKPLHFLPNSPLQPLFHLFTWRLALTLLFSATFWGAWHPSVNFLQVTSFIIRTTCQAFESEVWLRLGLWLGAFLVRWLLSWVWFLFLRGRGGLSLEFGFKAQAFSHLLPGRPAALFWKEFGCVDNGRSLRLRCNGGLIAPPCILALCNWLLRILVFLGLIWSLLWNCRLYTFLLIFWWHFGG